MMLRLSFFGRARMWAELVHGNGERVFVPTTDALRVGDAVTLEVEAPDLWAPLVLNGLVTALQALAGRSAAGIFVKLDAASVERCREALGVDQEAAARLVGRSERRVDCSLTARLLAPTTADGFIVKTLSVHELTLTTPLPLLPKAPVKLAITLPTGHELAVNATTLWLRADLHLAGLRIDDTEQAVLDKLDGAVRSLDHRLTPAPSSGITVVVADDEEAILEFIAKVVETQGHRVVRASRGDEAWNLIRRECPKLVFLDVLMPGIDGLALCKAIRADATLHSTRIVLLSAMGEDRLLPVAREAGANDSLTKPVKLELVRALMAKYL